MCKEFWISNAIKTCITDFISMYKICIPTDISFSFTNIGLYQCMCIDLY